MNRVPPLSAEHAMQLRSTVGPDAEWLYRAMWAYSHALGVDRVRKRDVRAVLRLRRRYPVPFDAGLALAERRTS